MAIKDVIGKVALQRLFSKHGVPRYRTEEEELEELKEKAKRKRVKKPKPRKPKHKEIPPAKGREFSKDVKRRERRNKGK